MVVHPLQTAGFLVPCSFRDSLVFSTEHPSSTKDKQAEAGRCSGGSANLSVSNHKSRLGLSNKRLELEISGAEHHWFEIVLFPSDQMFL